MAISVVEKNDTIRTVYQEKRNANAEKVELRQMVAISCKKESKSYAARPDRKNLAKTASSQCLI